MAFTQNQRDDLNDHLKGALQRVDQGITHLCNEVDSNPTLANKNALEAAWRTKGHLCAAMADCLEASRLSGLEATNQFGDS